MEAKEHGDNEKHELRAKLDAATEKAKEVCKRLQEQTVTAAKATDKAVHEHPYQAIGIAFGVGLLIGMVAARGRCGTTEIESVLVVEQAARPWPGDYRGWQGSL